mmetsp:Transcript_9635/g.30876  ORF Transcript_9635/g.30876 Transcript_9635/m.30876 type:complete len:463 (+) Transcript_9635:427-1815(+)
MEAVTDNGLFPLLTAGGRSSVVGRGEEVAGHLDLLVEEPGRGSMGVFEVIGEVVEDGVEGRPRSGRLEVVRPLGSRRGADEEAALEFGEHRGARGASGVAGGAVVSDEAEGVWVYAGSGGERVDVLPRGLGELGAARVDEGALVRVLRGFPGVVDKLPFVRVAGAVLSQDGPVLPKRETKHVPTRRRVSHELAVLEDKVKVHLLAQTQRIRGGLLIATAGSRHCQVDRDLHAILLGGFGESVHLTIEAIVSRVPAEDLVPCALQRGWIKGLDRRHGRRRRFGVRPGRQYGYLDTSVFLHSAVQETDHLLVPVLGEASRDAGVVPETLRRAGHALAAVRRVEARLRGLATPSRHALRVYQRCVEASLPQRAQLVLRVRRRAHRQHRERRRPQPVSRCAPDSLVLLCLLPLLWSRRHDSRCLDRVRATPRRMRVRREAARTRRQGDGAPPPPSPSRDDDDTHHL